MTLVPAEIPLHDPETMAALKRRSLILLAIVVPAIVLTIVLVISESRSLRVAGLARQVIPALVTQGGRTWTSNEMTFSDAEMDILETRDYVYRTYTDGRGPSVDLCVIFSEDNRKGTHPPDVCLQASGLSILSHADRTIEVAGSRVTLRELVTVGPAGQAIYFAYFYKCGDYFTPSFYRQQVQIVWNGLTRQNASGALIRYSTPMDLSALPAARARTDQLIAATFPAIRDRLNVRR